MDYRHNGTQVIISELLETNKVHTDSLQKIHDHYTPCAALRYPVKWDLTYNTYPPKYFVFRRAHSTCPDEVRVSLSARHFFGGSALSFWLGYRRHMWNRTSTTTLCI